VCGVRKRRRTGELGGFQVKGLVLRSEGIARKRGPGREGKLLKGGGGGSEDLLLFVSTLGWQNFHPEGNTKEKRGGKKQ